MIPECIVKWGPCYVRHNSTHDLKENSNDQEKSNLNFFELEDSNEIKHEVANQEKDNEAMKQEKDNEAMKQEKDNESMNQEKDNEAIKQEKEVANQEKINLKKKRIRKQWKKGKQFEFGYFDKFEMKAGLISVSVVEFSNETLFVQKLNEEKIWKKNLISRKNCLLFSQNYSSENVTKVDLTFPTVDDISNFLKTSIYEKAIAAFCFHFNVKMQFLEKNEIKNDNEKVIRDLLRGVKLSKKDRKILGL